MHFEGKAFVKIGISIKKVCILDMKELLQKNRELISYLIFGVLTTLVNYVSYLLFAPLFETTTVPTIIAWVLSVIFAYVSAGVDSPLLGSGFLFRGAGAVRHIGCRIYVAICGYHGI